MEGVVEESPNPNDIDFSAIIGKHYLRASIPTWFQNRRSFGVTAEYKVGDGGKIHVTNTEFYFILNNLHKHVSRGVAMKGDAPGKLKITFIRTEKPEDALILGDYNVRLLEQGNFLFVTNNDDSDAWVLTKEPNSDITPIMARIREEVKFDTSGLQYVGQFPDDSFIPEIPTINVMDIKGEPQEVMTGTETEAEPAKPQPAKQKGGCIVS